MTAAPKAWTPVGIEDSDGERCECCGTVCPKRRVVLTDGDFEQRLGSSCAALRVAGVRSTKAAKLIESQAADAYRRRMDARTGRVVNFRGETIFTGTAGEVRTRRWSPSDKFIAD